MSHEPENGNDNETKAFESYLMGFDLPELPADTTEAILAPARKEAARSSLWGQITNILSFLFQPAWAFSMAVILFLLNLAVDGLPARIVGRPRTDSSKRSRPLHDLRDLESDTGLDQRYILARMGPSLADPIPLDPSKRHLRRPDLEGSTGS